MLFTDNLLYDFAGIFVALVAITVTYIKWKYAYWRRRGVTGPDPIIPFGNALDLVLGKKSMGELWQDIYFDLKHKGHRHGGAFLLLTRVYVPVDLEIVKAILQTDFQHFWGHGAFVNEQGDPFSSNVFNLEGPKWKHIRAKLTPTFTSGKMKMMFHTLVECTTGLKELLEKQPENQPVVIKDVIGRFTTDIIYCRPYGDKLFWDGGNVIISEEIVHIISTDQPSGSCAFGIEGNSMKDPDSEFRKWGKIPFELSPLGFAKQMCMFVVPHWILKMANFRITDKGVENFFFNAVLDTINYREKNNVVRKDFMHMMIQLKNRGVISEDDKLINIDGKEEGSITINEIAAQCFIFFVAGFETSSTTVNWASLELALNPDVQKTAREEINRVLEKYDGKITYEGVMEMTYLENLLYETLRKYPPVPELFRTCNKEYTVPGTNLVIEKDVTVMIPALAIHYDPEFYPNPEKFDPNRFTEENKQKRPQMSWLPFGEGPRICIGMRFGMMQSKIALITLLTNYEITLNEKTKVPIVFSKTEFILTPHGGIWIDLHKISK